MHPALWVAKTGLDAQQDKMRAISNNLANVNTVGFKADRMVFEELYYQTLRQPGAETAQGLRLPSGLVVGTGVRTMASQKIHTQGGALQTGNDLDVSIEGRGFFQVTMPDGSIGYTRNGQFQLNAEGDIVMANGYKLEPALTIPPGTLSITIGTDGTVSALTQGNTTPTQIGTIQLADFVNPAGLQPIGLNLFKETAASGSPQLNNPGTSGVGTVQQGALESSNVNVVEELVNMIETERAYEMNSKSISSINSMMEYLNQHT